MKKICKIFGLILTLAILLVTPGILTISQGTLAAISALDTETDIYQHAAPNQSATPFNESPIDVSAISQWQANTGSYLVAQHLTSHTDFDNLRAKYSKNQALLDTNPMAGHQPVIIATDNSNLSARGYYLSGSMSLPANGYFRISVDYLIIGEKASGAFYFNDNQYIALNPTNNWLTATFYVHTAIFTATDFTAKVYFGSANENSVGAVYYDNFTVTAINAEIYTQETATTNDRQKELDFATADQNDVEFVKAFDNTDFTPDNDATANVKSMNQVRPGEIVATLNFADTEYFYAQSNQADPIMLMAANQGRTKLDYDQSYQFTPKPHEVYMFQFYSIASPELSKFYLRIGNIYENIAIVSDYPYYNGWQLNTVFLVAGHNEDQEYEIGFVLGYDENITGWVAIDDLRLYKVSGAYAEVNQGATGVHDLNDLNQTETEPTIANAYFELGTASDLQSATYPYPLKASSWETNHPETNGIVNPLFWKDFGVENPGRNNAVSDNRTKDNNNIYMLRNLTTVADHQEPNTLTSPALTVTQGQTTYISFDAYGQTTTTTRAIITTEDGVELGNIAINDNSWHHYEFAINESEYASTRSYYLKFTMIGKGATFLDNIYSSDTAYEYATTAVTTQQTIDLANQINKQDLWETDGADFKATAYADGSIDFANQDQVTTTLTHSFGYTFTTDEYYQITVTARGENAHLGLSGFEGKVTVVTDAEDPTATSEYQLFLQATADLASTNLTITLGSTKEDEHLDGSIHLVQVTVANITEDEYNLANEKKSDKVVIMTIPDTTPDTDTGDNRNDNNFFGENWWYLIPSLITALAIILAIICYFVRKIKFDRHITKKTSSYARDVKLQTTTKKIVAEKTAKVDNVVDETPHN